MPATQKVFAINNALIGALIGISIGLGMLNFGYCIGLGIVLFMVFGYKEPLEKVLLGIQQLLNRVKL